MHALSMSPGGSQRRSNSAPENATTPLVRRMNMLAADEPFVVSSVVSVVALHLNWATAALCYPACAGAAAASAAMTGRMRASRRRTAGPSGCSRGADDEDAAGVVGRTG